MAVIVNYLWAYSIGIRYCSCDANGDDDSLSTCHGLVTLPLRVKSHCDRFVTWMATDYYIFDADVDEIITTNQLCCVQTNLGQSVDKKFDYRAC